VGTSGISIVLSTVYCRWTTYVGKRSTLYVGVAYIPLVYACVCAYVCVCVSMCRGRRPIEADA